MKKYLIFFCALFIGCATVKEVKERPNPCQDYEFLRLRDMAPEHMNAYEYDYFKTKTKECEEYTKELEQAKYDEKTSATLYYVVLGVAAAAAVFFLSTGKF